MNTAAFDKKKSPTLVKWLKLLAACIVCLYLLVWAISSPVIKHFIKPILQQHQLTLSQSTSISYNPFLSQVNITDLALFRNQKNTVLSIDELTIRLTLFRLLFDEIVISKFELNSAQLIITKNEKQLLIAGIDVNKNNRAEKTTQPSAVVYQVILPELILQQVNIDIDNDAKLHNININKLLVNQVKASQIAQQAMLSLDSTIDSAAVVLTADVALKQGHGEINSQISINNYPLNKFKDYVNALSELSGAFSLTSQQQLMIEPNQLNFHINNVQVNNESLIVAKQQQFFALDKFESNFNNVSLVLAQGLLTDLAGTGQITLNNANVYNGKVAQKLAFLEQLALKDISFDFDEVAQVTIPSLVIDNIYGSKNESLSLPALATLKQLSISDLMISELELAINEITLDSLTSNLIINKDKAIANLVTLSAPQHEQNELTRSAKETENENSTPKAEYLISLNKFSLINENHISFQDHSVEPVYTRQLYIDTLQLGALSNSKDKQEQQTPFTLTGRSNKYAHFNFNGYAAPFAKLPKHHLKGFLKELSLPAVSTYMKQAMQMELKSGQLNTALDVTLTGEQLDGNLQILLQGLETTIADSNEAGALIDQGALPFNIALGMLKDSNGDVELDVPLSGSTSDPQFGLSSIVTLITQKAIWMATQDYLMTTFVPYANIVSAAMTVGEFALKLRFDDLIYQDKQIEPNVQQKAYLDSFIALMREKEDTRVNICAISTPRDINLPLGTQISNKLQIQELKQIAQQREVAFKDYIIEHGNIASARLLLCAAKIDSSATAKPRIELSV